METPLAPGIISVERLDGHIIVTFADGISAVYSSSFLYANLNQAEEIQEPGTIM